MSLNNDQILAKRRLILSLINLDDLNTCRNCLLELKKMGFSKNTVYTWLESYRVLFKDDEEVEDLILEVLDIVTGYCSSDLEVW